MRDCGTGGKKAARSRERLRRRALGDDGQSIRGATPHPTGDQGGERDRKRRHQNDIMFARVEV